MKSTTYEKIDHEPQSLFDIDDIENMSFSCILHKP
jgi:hypothetical protein